MNFCKKQNARNAGSGAVDKRWLQYDVMIHPCYPIAKHAEVIMYDQHGSEPIVNLSIRINTNRLFALHTDSLAEKLCISCKNVWLACKV